MWPTHWELISFIEIVVNVNRITIGTKESASPFRHFLSSYKQLLITWIRLKGKLQSFNVIMINSLHPVHALTVTHNLLIVWPVLLNPLKLTPLIPMQHPMSVFKI